MRAVRNTAGTAYRVVYLVDCASLPVPQCAPRAQRPRPRSTNQSHERLTDTDATRTSCGMEAENLDGEPRRRSLNPSCPEPLPSLSEHSRNDALDLFSSTIRIRARGDIKQ